MTRSTGPSWNASSAHLGLRRARVEIPNNGDFATRQIGDDPFVLIRGDDAKVRLLFDSCSHRSTQLCRAERGNALTFRCPYHGWTYNNSGELVGVPQNATGFKALDKSQWGMLAAPEIDTYEGLIFAALEPQTKSLREHLGDFTWYLDLHVKLTGGMEVVGEPHRWIVDADWKSGADNFSGDSYHTQMPPLGCRVDLVEKRVCSRPAGRTTFTSSTSTGLDQHPAHRRAERFLRLSGRHSENFPAGSGQPSPMGPGPKLVRPYREHVSESVLCTPPFTPHRKRPFTAFLSCGNGIRGSGKDGGLQLGPRSAPASAEYRERRPSPR